MPDPVAGLALYCECGFGVLDRPLAVIEVYGREEGQRLPLQQAGGCDVVIEAGVVAGYVIAWAVRKARRVAGRLDAQVDAVVDGAMDRLREVVAAKLGAHPVLDDVDEEAATGDGQVSEVTRQQVELAVTAAARKDDQFGQAVTELLARLQAAEQATGVYVLAGADSRIFTGNAYATASGTGIAFGQVAGDVYTRDAGREGLDPSGPGRSRH